jgi:hypothetical protein
MTKSILIIWLFSICSLKSINAQVYNLESINGNKIRIELNYMPDTKTLAVASAKDTLYLVNYIALDRVRVLGGKFLQVSYTKRAGSNEGLKDDILLCVNNNKIIQSTHIISFSEYDMRNTSHEKNSLDEYELFKIKMQLIGNDKLTYKLKLNIHNEGYSQITNRANHTSDKFIILNFDSKLNVFYEKYIHANTYFKVYDPKTQREVKQNVKGLIPAINVYNKSYYYIKSRWYELSKNNHLIQHSF